MRARWAFKPPRLQAKPLDASGPLKPLGEQGDEAGEIWSARHAEHKAAMASLAALLVGVAEAEGTTAIR